MKQNINIQEENSDLPMREKAELALDGKNFEFLRNIDEDRCLEVKKILLNDLEFIMTLNIGDLIEAFNDFFSMVMSGDIVIYVLPNLESRAAGFTTRNLEPILFEKLKIINQWEKEPQAMLLLNESSIKEGDLFLITLVHEIGGHFLGWRKNKLKKNLPDEEIRAILETTKWYVKIKIKYPEISHPLYEAILKLAQQERPPKIIRDFIDSVVKSEWSYS